LTNAPNEGQDIPDIADWLSPLAILAVVMRRRLVLFATVFAVEAILLLVAVRRPVEYTSTVAFIPEGVRPTTSATSLAAQFGVNIGGSDGLSSPQFYPELVRSPMIMRRLVDSTYALDSAGPRRSLVDVYGLERFGHAEGTFRALTRLTQQVVPTAAIRTGIVTVTVTAPDPRLAHDLAAQLLREITRFNLHTRQGRASAERQFIERRLAEVRDSARVAEERLQRFLLDNRDYSRSPVLTLRHARLERDVQAQQLLLNTLAPSYEQAKIEEVRDTPVLTIVRAPELPLHANPRGRVRLMILGLIGSTALGIAVALLLDIWSGVRRSGGAGAELNRAYAGLRDSVRRDGLLRGVLGVAGRQQA